MQNEEPVELWHVEVAPNDVRIVTLEQLDEAFQQGLVNERTRVFQDGMDEPAFLGELLGLGEDDEGGNEETTAQSAPISTTGPSRHYQETLIGLTAATTPSQAPRSAPPPMRNPPPPARAASAYPPVVQAAPAYRPTSGPPPMQPMQQQPSRRPPPPPEGAWPPVVARQAPPVAPVTRTAPPPSAAVAPSVVPMAMDLGDDFDFPRPKRRGKGILLGGGVLAIAAGVALAVTGQGQQILNQLNGASTPAPAPVKAASMAPQPFKSHALDVGTAEVKLKDAPPPVVITTRENEAQVLGASATTKPAETTDSKSPSAKSTPSKSAPTKSVAPHRAKGGGGAARGGSHGGAPKAPGMTGGSKYDPLNGSL